MKRLVIGSTMVEIICFLDSLRFCELLFAMLTVYETARYLAIGVHVA